MNQGCMLKNVLQKLLRKVLYPIAKETFNTSYLCYTFWKEIGVWPILRLRMGFLSEYNIKPSWFVLNSKDSLFLETYTDIYPQYSTYFHSDSNLYTKKL